MTAAALVPRRPLGETGHNHHLVPEALERRQDRRELEAGPFAFRRPIVGLRGAGNAVRDIDGVQPANRIRVPRGTRMYVEAYYDNSKANRFNPNPERTVYLGRMTWEEMMAPFFGVLIDSNVDPNQVLKLGRFAVQGSGA